MASQLADYWTVTSSAGLPPGEPTSELLNETESSNETSDPVTE
jgi:hypothetical protein